MKQLRARVVVAGDELGVVAVESVETERRSTGGGGYLYCTLQPVAVVVSRGSDVFAVDMEAQPIDREELRRRCQDLDAAIMKRATITRRRPGQESRVVRDPGYAPAGR